MSTQPNILVFLPDGLQGRAVLPGSGCHTPHFDRVAERGIRFRRAHAPIPTCSPSRASLMTGLLPHNHGVLQVEHCVDPDQSVLRTQHPHWAQRLSAAGYRTGYFGKWHIERTNRLEDFGWQVNGCNEAAAFRGLGAGEGTQEPLLREGSFARYETTPEGYQPVLHYGVTETPTAERDFARTTRRARQFVSEACRRGEPWACCVSFPEPNYPLVAGRTAFERYDVDALALPASLRDELAGSPGLYRRQQRILAHMTEREWRELRAVYFALITELDSQLGVLLDTLEAAGQLDRTVVIVASDHGRYVGAHSMDHHNFGAFEEIYNIPLIVAGPGVAQGVTSDALVGLHDLCPTLIELGGAEPIPGIDAASFAGLLSDPAGQAGRFTTGYAQYHGTRFLLSQRVLWDGPWKFVFNGFDEDELYHLDDDPHELRNLARDPEQQPRIRALMARVWEQVKATNDRALLETHYSPMRFAAVGPNAASAG